MSSRPLYRFTAQSRFCAPTVLERDTPDALETALVAKHYLPWLVAWVRDELEFPDCLPKKLVYGADGDETTFTLDRVESTYVFTEIEPDGEILQECVAPADRLDVLTDALYRSGYREWVVQWAIAMAGSDQLDERSELLVFPQSGVTYSLAKIERSSNGSN